MARRTSLFLQLSKNLGQRQAQQEWRWIQDALRRNSAQGSSSLEQMVMRRAAGEPLQYILGTQPFGNLELFVRKPVLIPRPETEDWTIKLASRLSSLPRPIKLLDLCTGSGCIPLLLCHLLPQGSLRAIGLDKSDDAIQLATDNANHVNVSPFLDSQIGVSVNHSNTFSAIRADVLDTSFLQIPKFLALQPFDVLTSNPPYIPKHEYDGLPPSVRDFEDRDALLGDPEPIHEGAPVESHRNQDRRGLTFYRAIANLIQTHAIIRKGGLVALEVGHNQSNEVAELMQKVAKMSKIEVWKDPWGVERCVLAWK